MNFQTFLSYLSPYHVLLTDDDQVGLANVPGFEKRSIGTGYVAQDVIQGFRGVVFLQLLGCICFRLFDSFCSAFFRFLALLFAIGDFDVLQFNNPFGVEIVARIFLPS